MIYFLDIYRIRFEYRITGTLIGSMPHFQQQNLFNGVPLLLSRDEVTLLLRLNVIKLYRADVPFVIPSEEEIKEFEVQRRFYFKL